MSNRFWAHGRKALAIVAASTLILSTASFAAAKPGKVKITTGTSTASSITLKWAAGTGAKPTKYTVSCKGTGVATVTKTVTGKSTTVSGLIPNTSYACAITAFAKTVKGLAVSKTVLTKPTVPSAPVNPMAVPGDAKAIVSWGTPASDGGSPITSFTVTSTPGNRTCTVMMGIGGSCTVTGLNNNSSYSFSVVATNAVGSGASSNTAAIIPVALPDMPVVTTSSADGTVTINWEHPLNAPVTKYVISRVGASSVEVNYPTKTYTFSGLTNCQPVNFSIYAENASGQSITNTFSAAAGGIAARPGEVQGLNVVAGDKKLTVSFRKPLQPGLRPITSYQVRASVGGQFTDGTLMTTLDAVPISYDITGLSNGITYTVSALAVSDCGVAVGGINSEKTATPVWSGRPARVVDLDKGQITNVSIGSNEKLGYQFTSYVDMSDPSRWFSLTLTCHAFEYYAGNPVDWYDNCPQPINTELFKVEIFALDGTSLGVNASGLGGWQQSSGKWYYYFRPNLTLSINETYLVVVTYGTASPFQVPIPGSVPTDYTFYDTGRKIDFWPYEIRA